MLALPAAQFLRLAERLPAYRGVLRLRAEEEYERTQTQPASPEPRAQPTTTKPSGAEQRHNLRQRGGEAVAVPSDQPSYLEAKLKEARRVV